MIPAGDLPRADGTSFFIEDCGGDAALSLANPALFPGVAGVPAITVDMDLLGYSLYNEVFDVIYTIEGDLCLSFSIVGL